MTYRYPDWLHPIHSKMELALGLRLAASNVNFETDKAFCIQQTIPDFYFPNNNLAVYIDGLAVHQERAEKDELLM